MTAKRRGRGRRRVAVVTGTRAEYGLLRSTMEAVQRHRGLELQVVVTGMHLLRKFGHTVDDIQRDGWKIDARVRMQAGTDDPVDQAAGLSRGISGVAKFMEQAGTDVVVVLGDRVEAMAGALAAVTTGRFVAHMHGGDVAPGDFDNPLRNAITKLAHLHLPATQAAGKRIAGMGESADRIHVVGAPGLDRLIELIGRDRSRRPKSRRALVLQHPCGRSAKHERRVMNALLHAVEDVDLHPTILYPNSDRGHSGILQAIEAHRSDGKAGVEISVVRSLDRDAFLRELMAADVIVGNSSAGVIEAATAGTPAVNVGDRQKGRERAIRSVVEADESRSSIRSGLARALRKRPIIGRSSVYGGGGVGRHVAELIAAMPLDDHFRRKSSVPGHSSIRT